LKRLSAVLAERGRSRFMLALLVLAGPAQLERLGGNRKTYDLATVLDPARPLFDVMLLGLGPDGHTASLLPGEPVLDECQRWMAAVSHGRPEVRITLTYPAIDRSRRVAFLVAGREKAAIFRAIRAGDRRAPAARVRPSGDLVWFVDRAAAGE
jgi:6-phosphogluconolactonase